MDQFVDTIEPDTLIARAPGNPTVWRAFLQSLTERLDGDSGFMLTTDLVEQENTRILYSYNLPSDFRHAYENQLNRQDAFNLFVSRTPRRVCCNQNVAACGPDACDRNLLRHESLKYRFGLALPCNHRYALSLFVNRGAAFDRQEYKTGSKLLKRLLPLLEEAIRAEKSHKINSQLLHHLGNRFDVYLMVDRHLHILFADPVYANVIAAMPGVRLDGESVGLADPDSQKRLLKLLSERRRADIVIAANGLSITAIPVESLENLYHWESHKESFILAFSGDHGEDPAVSRLTDIYALSRCEALCALHFLQTPSISEVADSTCRSQETVRNHIKRTMQKMGVHNQAALMKKLIALQSL